MTASSRPGPGARARPGLLVKVALAAGATVAALLAAELSSRDVFPVAPAARFLDAGGGAVEIFDGPWRLRPGLSFRQVASEYDARTTTGAGGYRNPHTDAPELVFLGDSFTFGQGLTDEETFAALYCFAADLRCANLGHPGTGTRRQVESLARRLNEDRWRPRAVNLFVFAMTSALMAGNDLVDTAEEARDDRSAGAAQEASETDGRAPAAGLAEWIVDRRASILRVSNLARITYAAWGPQLRTWFSPAAREEDVAAGLAAMGQELARLDALSAAYGFAYTVYVLHPVQDLMGGTWPETTRAVADVAGGASVIDTAPALLDNPAGYYYQYDGHLNAAGARRIAALLPGGAG